MAVYRRSRSFFTSGMIDIATQRCHAAISQLKEAGLMTMEWHIKFSNELAIFAHAQLDIPATVSAYEELLKLTADDAATWAWLRALSHCTLAQIIEDDHCDLDRAQWHGLQAWKIVQRYLQPRDPLPKCNFEDVLLFLADRGCPDHLHSLICCTQDLHSRIECRSTGLWTKQVQF